MRNKKAPSLAAVGAGQEGGKEDILACPHSATPARPSQSECCACCQFFRVVALASGHDRKLCMMTGEKLRTSAGWCDLFAPGKWEDTWADPAPAPLSKWLLRTAERLRALTHARCSGMVEVPKSVRRHTRLSGFPRAGKSRVAYSAVKAPAVRLPGGLLSHIGRVVTSACPRGCGGFTEPGSVTPCLFCFPSSQICEALMHSITFASVVAPSRNLIPAGEVRHA